MSELLSASQQAVFDQIDETTFWAIARAHRTGRRKGVAEATAFEAAIDVLSRRFPAVSRRTIVAVTKAVVIRTASGPLDWFWE